LDHFYDIINHTCRRSFRENPSTTDEFVVLNLENPILNNKLAVYEIAFSPGGEVHKNFLLFERFSFYYIQNTSAPKN
jgi:hypothetical protein